MKTTFWRSKPGSRGSVQRWMKSEPLPLKLHTAITGIEASQPCLLAAKMAIQGTAEIGRTQRRRDPASSAPVPSLRCDCIRETP